MGSAVTILPFNRAKAARYAAFPASGRLNGHEMGSGFRHLIRQKTPAISITKGLNGKMDKMAMGVGKESNTREALDTLSGGAQAACEVCRFWGGGAEFMDGYCRKRAPVLVVFDGGPPETRWPVTKSAWMCGDFEARNPHG